VPTAILILAAENHDAHLNSAQKNPIESIGYFPLEILDFRANETRTALPAQYGVRPKASASLLES
jgi:hypothetical protein